MNGKNRELVRMNLTGLSPELRRQIKALAEKVIREFSGAPEDVADFNDAREVLELLAETEAGS